MSEKLVFWRDEHNQVSCIFDKCCHRGASLSAGKIVNNHVECPFHGFQYDATGKVNYIPANGKNKEVPDQFRVNAYVVKEAYGFVWLWYSDEGNNVPEIPFFEDLRQGFSYGGFSETWPVHYTRAIENQLDVVHLPFVHKTTIGRGGKTLVNGPVVKWKENRMTFYVKNENDNGQNPENPDEIKDYEQSRIASRSRVVLTQLPIKSELAMGENLVQGDLPIIEFRKRRDFLKR